MPINNLFTLLTKHINHIHQIYLNFHNIKNFIYFLTLHKSKIYFYLFNKKNHKINLSYTCARIKKSTLFIKIFFNINYKKI